MEWVETTAKTVEAAKDLALDQLGVDELDAEFEVLAEPKAGLFGRVRGEARVRARVRPTTPRPKADQRDRRRRRKGGGGGGGRQGGRGGGRNDRSSKDDGDESPRSEEASSDDAATEPQPKGGQDRRRGRGSSSARSGDDGGATKDGPVDADAATEDDTPREGGRGGRKGGRDRNQARKGRSDRDRADKADRQQESSNVEPLSPTRQAEIAGDFLLGLAESFGTSGEIEVVLLEDDLAEARLLGDDLGLMIGPRGATLGAIYELAKTVVQRHGGGEREGRFRIDIGSYRAKRRAALEQFATKVAQQVLDEGEELALEPMGAADRKVVHDTVNGIDGVTTRSEGEEPRRRVVLEPAD